MTEFKSPKELITTLQRSFPAFRRKGRMLLLGEMEYLIRAIVLDASAFSRTSFYPTVFVQPLYEPRDYFVLTFGGRLRPPGTLVWDTAEDPGDLLLKGMKDAITEQAMPFLGRFRQPVDLALACEGQQDQRFSWLADDINVLETAAHSWLLAGNVRKSIAKLETIQHELRMNPDDRKWVRDLHARVSQFLDWLRAGDEESARNQLLRWTGQTTKALKLEEFRKASGGWPTLPS